MFYVVGKVFLENARGAIGETDEEMLNHIAHLVANDPDVIDIQRVEVVKEGEFLHVEVVAEVDPFIQSPMSMMFVIGYCTLFFRQKGVRDVLISFDEDDGVRTWTRTE